ncbi:Frag1/DRAM/Sfk1 family-domain-containing protein [Tricladium varicosporioides]|nr:Frag1/DRAM/Sfk1 family-domain-containing protein [Hymenoscyphus varicosporioides]
MWGISYWIFPVISGLCWLGMLMGLLIHWCVIGRPHYASMDPFQSIAYISDVGAQSLKPLFIAGSCVTTIFLDLSFLSESWLRHRGRLAKNTSLFQKILTWLSLIFAVIGTAGLILLSIFDTLRHPHLHDAFLVLFIGGYIISAVFICWEYQRLGIHFRQHRILRISFWVKLAFILLEVALAIAFGVTGHAKHYNAAAVLEWTIAFVFTFYVFSFFIDLLPAVRTRDPQHRFGAGVGETELQVEQNDVYANYNDNGRMTAESERTLGTNDVRTVNGVKHKVENGQS